MSATCSTCSGSHTTNTCSLDLTSIFKEIIDTLHSDNPTPNSNQTPDNYTGWDRQPPPFPSMDKMIMWFANAENVVDFAKDYDTIWDTDAKEDIKKLEAMALNLQKIQFTIDHLEAICAQKKEAVSTLMGNLEWSGFAARNHKIISKLHQVQSPTSSDSPTSNFKTDVPSSSKTRFTPYNIRRSTINRQSPAPPPRTIQNPSLIGDFTVKMPRYLP